MKINGVGTFQVRPGDFVVVPSPCVQNYLPDNPSSESRLHVFRLMFDRELASGRKHRSTTRNIPFLDVLKKAFPTVRYFPGGLKSGVGPVLRQILGEIDEAASCYREAVHGLLLLLVANVLRLAQQENEARVFQEANRSAQIVSQAQAWLEDNFDRPIKLADLAWHLDLSEEHLARIFRRHTGNTVLEVIRSLRVAKARRLLLGSNQTLSNISRACGFRSLAVFSVNFKRAAGMGPGAYRRQLSAKVLFQKSDWQAEGPR